MIKAFIAAVATIIVGIAGCAVCASWINAPELGVVLALGVMGGCIVYFNEKKR